MQTSGSARVLTAARAGDDYWTFTAADVVSVGTAGAQGIAPGELAEVLRAIRANAAYVNVHTVGFPSGEIRGQFDRGHDDYRLSRERLGRKFGG
jgi:CHRD domain